MSSVRVLLRASVALAIAGGSLAHATNGYLSHGYGIKAKGAAGVGAALPQDTLTIATNPAGLIEAGHRSDMGVELFVPDRGGEIRGNAFGPDQSFDGNGTEYFLIPELGHSHLVCDDLAVGFAMYGNGGMNTDYDKNPYARFGSKGNSYMNFEQLFIAPAMAWEFSPGQTIGLALNLAYQRFEAKGLSAFAPLSADPANLADNGTDDGFGAGVRIGWLGQITDRLTLGASWQSTTRMQEFDRYAGLFAEQGGFDIPENYVLGAAFELSEATTIALDWQTIEYNDVASVGNDLGQLFLGNPLGSDNGPGFGWQDMSTLKIAVLHRYSDRVTLRAGYSRGDQPVPRDQTFFNIIAPGVVEEHASLGATFAVNERNELSIAYTHGLEEEVRGKGSIPPMLGGGEANISLAEDSFGLAWSMRY
ncbi:MAG: outer membrane protein transport protein [Gammaproteobacteria bacterium]|nr:outer membrane protein transport protein [Gammaproteobacteria bacterium]